jgi:hypothetical protein
VGLYVINVYDIDMGSNTYYLTGYLWVKWTGEEDLSSSIELTNTVEEWGTMITPFYEEPMVLPDGSSYQVFRIQGRFFQPFDLVNYPLDKQKLTLLVETADDTIDNVVFAMDNEASGYDQELLVPGWHISNLQLESLVHNYGTSFGDPEDPGVYSAARFTLNLERVQNLFLWKLMLPLLIVMLTNWLALVLKPNMIDLRTAMPATALLTMVFLQQASLDAIPQVSSLVLMDKIYAVAYLLIVVTFANIIYDNTVVVEDDPQSINKLKKSDLIGLTMQVSAFVLIVGYMVISVL